MVQKINDMMPISPQAEKVLRTLNEAGYRAYLVGGCVRDALLGTEPKDYDITTSALPEETKQAFTGFHVVDTGLKHGTVTVVLDHTPIEVTTFRADQEYLDHRHPSSVVFTRSLEEDLARRDLTINAMAWHPGEGLIDLFGGESDLSSGIIRCVGDPDERFREDALRILRALRFASRLDFRIEPETEAALLRNAGLLEAISAERIASELNGILLGRGPGEILVRFVEVLGIPIPELLPMKDFEQHNPHHHLDVLRHTAAVVDAVPAEKDLRLAALFHDIGKPSCFTQDENGTGHFYGHAKISRNITTKVMRRLKYDNATREQVEKLVMYHDLDTEGREVLIRRWMRRLSPELFARLLFLKRADILGQHPDYRDGLKVLDETRNIMERLLADHVCLTMQDLAVTGADLIAAGVPRGPIVGILLDKLLDRVAEGRLENRKDTLIDWVKENYHED